MKLTTCILLTWILGIHVLYAQSIQLQGVVSATHVNLSNGEISLSGSFGQPITSSNSNSILTSGFYSASTNLLTSNLVPNITINNFDFTVTNPILSASIQDLDGIANATLSIKPIGASDFTQISLSNPVENVFSYSVSADDFDNMGLEYYFEASDETGLDSRNPLSGSAYSYTFKSAVDIPSTLIGLGTDSEHYKMISIPYQIGSNDVSNIFKVLTELGNDNSKWRLFAHTGGDEFLEYPSNGFANLERGKSYWLLIKQEHFNNISFSDVTAPENNQNKLFTLDLQSGWNMIGNPYTIPISWKNVRSYNSGVDIGVLKLFDGSYANGDELLPFQGGVVYLEGDDTTIEIPFSGQISGGGRIRHQPFESNLNASNWQLDLKIEQGDHKRALGGIGMHTDARNEKDYFDDLNPPRFLSYLELNFPHPEHPLGYFNKDIVETQSQYMWQLELNSFDDDPITLKWDNSNFGDHSKEIYLYDVQNQVMIDMRSSKQLVTSNNSQLKIYYGKDVLKQMGPDHSFAGVPYPNPTNSLTTPTLFPLVLDRQSTNHRVEASIYNKEGRLINEIFNGEMAPGLHHLRWDCDSSQGQKLSAGMYFYRIVIHSDQGQSLFTGKLIISN